MVDLAQVVRRLNHAMHWINRCPEDKCLKNKPRYSLDSVIHLLNNPVQLFCFCYLQERQRINMAMRNNILIICKLNKI